MARWRVVPIRAMNIIAYKNKYEYLVESITLVYLKLNHREEKIHFFFIKLFKRRPINLMDIIF